MTTLAWLPTISSLGSSSPSSSGPHSSSTCSGLQDMRTAGCGWLGRARQWPHASSCLHLASSRSYVSMHDPWMTTANAAKVIVTTKQAYVTGVTSEEAQHLVDEYGGYPLRYGKNGRAIASVVFAWLGLPCVIASYVQPLFLLLAIANHTLAPSSCGSRSTIQNASAHTLPT